MSFDNDADHRKALSRLFDTASSARLRGPVLPAQPQPQPHTGSMADILQRIREKSKPVALSIVGASQRNIRGGIFRRTKIVYDITFNRQLMVEESRERLDWCKENCSGRVEPTSYAGQRGKTLDVWTFNNESDMTLFRIRFP